VQLVFLVCIQIAADALHFTHNPQSILAQNFPYVTLGIPFFEQSFGDERQPGSVFHAVGHVGAIEIGSEAYVIGARNFYGVIDVLDDFFVADTRQFPLLDSFACKLVSLEELASFVIAAALVHFLANFGVNFRISFFRIAKFLA